MTRITNICVEQAGDLQMLLSSNKYAITSDEIKALVFDADPTEYFEVTRVISNRLPVKITNAILVDEDYFNEHK